MLSRNYPLALRCRMGCVNLLLGSWIVKAKGEGLLQVKTDRYLSPLISSIGQEK